MLAFGILKNFIQLTAVKLVYKLKEMDQLIEIKENQYAELLLLRETKKQQSESIEAKDKEIEALDNKITGFRR